MAENSTPGAALIEKVFQKCLSYAESVVGKKIGLRLLKSSYQKVLPYFHILQSFQLNDQGELTLQVSNPSEKEWLGFAVWMQQFMKEIRNFMIGLPEVAIEDITGDLQSELQATGFYEFYHQADELEY